jgi:glycosyltransferase involved in cell wall biosynthesis
MTSPRVVIGIPLYNHEAKLPEALSTLLAQSFGDFAIVACDDQSSDATPRIVQDFAARDSRIRYVRNDERLGYVGNANRCFRLARELYPDAEYFAWGSDHDAWHPRWLSVLVRELDQDPEAVMAFSATFIMDEDGTTVSRKDLRYTPNAGEDRLRRFRSVFFGLPMGNAIYGLFRAGALERTPLLRPHVLPDRLLLAELSLVGPARTTREFLFYRRYRSLFSKGRQVRASFPHGAPLYVHLPWWLAHAGALYRSYALRPAENGLLTRQEGLQVALRYPLYGMAIELRRLRRQIATAWKDGVRSGRAHAAQMLSPRVAHVVRMLIRR